jgi:16S rRNA (adenine1518-N6/adenine1519-N6)-dimethyltransferase
VHADLARVSAPGLRRELGVDDIVLAGNLPYQLTSHVLFACLDLEHHLRRAVFMVQREVAERIVAPPGGRDYGILSVLLRAWYRVEMLLRVKPGAFLPPPRVDSAVIRLQPLPVPALGWAERPGLVHLVKSVFNERRKVLRNTLKKFYGLDPAQLAAAQAATGVDLNRRPETLAVEEFVRLLRHLPAADRARPGAAEV